MKPRTVLILFVLLVILIPVARHARRPRQPMVTPASAARAPVLSDLDVNAVQRIDVHSPSATSTVIRVGGTWLVESLHRYPADFDRIVTELRRISGLDVGQVMQATDGMLAEFGLAEEGPEGSTRVILSGEDGGTLAELLIGKARERTGADTFGGMPEGHYVRTPGGPVILVKDNLSTVPRRSDEWISRTVVDVRSSEVAEVGMSSSGDRYTLTSTTQGTYELAGLDADQEVDATAAGNLTRILQMLQFAELVDPGKPEAELGFESPSTCVVKLRNGLAYTVSVGSVPAGPNGRYARLSVSYEPTPAPTETSVRERLAQLQASGQEPAAEGDMDARVKEELEKEIAAYEEQVKRLTSTAAAENDRLSRWTFVIPKPKADHLLLNREALIKKPAPPPAPETPASVPLLDAAGPETAPGAVPGS